MKREGLGYNPEEEKPKKPKRRRSHRGAAMLAAGLAFGAGGSEDAKATEPPHGQDTERYLKFLEESDVLE